MTDMNCLTQPCGQRVRDLVAFSIDFLRTYAPDKLSSETI